MSDNPYKAPTEVEFPTRPQSPETTRAWSFLTAILGVVSLLGAIGNFNGSLRLDVFDLLLGAMFSACSLLGFLATLLWWRNTSLALRVSAVAAALITSAALVQIAKVLIEIVERG